MADGESRRLVIPSAMSLSAIVLAVLAFFGVTRGPSIPAPGPALHVAGTALASEQSRGWPVGVSTIERVTAAHHPEASDKLAILDPLLRYHSARLANAKGNELGTDPKALYHWLLGAASGPDTSRAEPVSFLVAIVPDPLVSGTTYRYDQAIQGLTLGLRPDGYLLDAFRIEHWLTPRGRETGKEESARGGAHTEAGPVDRDLRAPGCILFRRAARADEPRTANLLVVLLVAETPIRGVNAAMLESSLDIVLDHAVQSRASRPIGEPLIRIVGPNFSGSASSIKRSLGAWLAAKRGEIQRQNLAAAPIVRWINGVALSIDPRDFERSLNAGGKGSLEFRSVVYSSVDLNLALFTYLNANARPAYGGDQVAYLTEESTGFGQRVQRDVTLGGADAAGKQSEAPSRNTTTASSAGGEKPFAMVFYTYPLHISEIRRRYARQTGGSAEGSVRLETKERLKFAFDEGSDTAEMMPIESPAIVSAYDELRLLEITEDIKRRNIRYAWLTATDTRDTLFMAEFLHRHCPNLQIVSISLDTAFLHDDRISDNRGTLFASTYPLWLEGQDPTWSPHESGDPHELRVRSFSDHTVIGIHNATLAHQIERASNSGGEGRAAEVARLQDALVGYRWMHGKEGDGPPIWISVASQEGFLPVQFISPGGVHGAVQPVAMQPHPNSYRNYFWQPQPPRFMDRKTWTWELSWRRWIKVLSGVTPVVPILLAAAMLGLVLLERGVEKRLRRETARSHSPLRLGTVKPVVDTPALKAVAEADARLAAMRSSLRPFHFPRLGRWVVALLPFAILATQNPYAGWLFLPEFHGFLLFLGITALLLWVGADRWPRRVSVAGALGLWLCGFLLTHQSSFEPYKGLSWGLLAALVVLFLVVLVRAIRLTLHWSAFQEVCEAVQSLPLGSVFDRLPPRLTSRFGSFGDALVGGGDLELAPRFEHVREALLAEAGRSKDDAGVPQETRFLASKIRAIEPAPAPLPLASPGVAEAHGARFARGLIKVLAPCWERRSSEAAYGDAPGSEGGSSGGAATPIGLAAQADQYVALEVVRYLNRHLDLIWHRVTSLTLAGLLLMAGVNSYPFQPAGRLFTWLMIVVFLAVAAVVFVLVGVNSNTLIARVNRLPAHRSVWNLDFLAKMVTYVGPLIGLLAAFSFGMSDILRIILGPFVR